MGERIPAMLRSEGGIRGGHWWRPLKEARVIDSRHATAMTPITMTIAFKDLPGTGSADKFKSLRPATVRGFTRNYVAPGIDGKIVQEGKVSHLMA